MTLPSPSSIAAIIDHTLLRADATAADIDRLCAESLQHRFAAVCVNPYWVPRASRNLGGAIAVASVVSFPLGAAAADIKLAETARALSDGAREIDVVVNIGALKSGDVDTVSLELEAIVAACHAHNALVKVILETGVLTRLEKKRGCLAVRRSGAAFVKTSTGFGAAGATVEDVTLLKKLVGPAVGVKAAGGIRDLQTLRAMVAAGATRIGTSAGVAILREAIAEAER